MKASTSTMAAALGAVCLTLLAGCGGDTKHGEGTKAGPQAPAAAVDVRVAPVVEEQLAQVRELAGSVQSAAVSNVSARIMAQVLSVLASEGDRVAKGRTLLVLDDRELQAKVRQAESALAQAEAGRTQAAARLELAAATHARYRALLEGLAISRQEYENVASQEEMARAGLAQADGAVAQAKGAVEEAKTWLAFAVIPSPVSGRVTARRVDPGSTAAPGQPLLAIEQDGRYRLEVPADASLSGVIAKGTSLTVTVDAAGYRGTAPVSDVVPAADPVSRTFIVKADLPADPRFASGQYARVGVQLGSRAAVVVPESALVRRGQLDGVFVVDGGKLAFRIVQAGAPAGATRREVLSGLSAGEVIVVDGTGRAVDGARVAGRAD